MAFGAVILLKGWALTVRLARRLPPGLPREIAASTGR
jgi:hypothetical protein